MTDFLPFSAFNSVLSISFGFSFSGIEACSRIDEAGGCNMGFIRTGTMGGAGGCKTGFILTGAIGGGSVISSSLSSTTKNILFCDFADLVSLGVELVCVAIFSSIFGFFRTGSDSSGDLLLVRCVWLS